MKALFLSVAAAAALFAAPALAQEGPTYYGGVSYSNISTDGVDADLGSITGRVGARFTPYLGAEGELSFGIRDDTVAGVKVEPKYDAALYGVASIPVSENWELFARAGYGTTRIEVGGVKADEESWNYGVGANYFIDGQNGVRADWTRRDFQDNGGEADVWSLGYVRRF